MKRSLSATNSELELERMKWRSEQYDHLFKALGRAQTNGVFWQGKFSMVKHENNMLRKQLRRQKA